MKIIKKLAAAFLSLTVLLSSVTLVDIKAKATASLLGNYTGIYNAVKVTVDYEVWANHDDVSNQDGAAKMDIVATSDTSSYEQTFSFKVFNANNIFAGMADSYDYYYKVSTSGTTAYSYTYDIKYSGNVFNATNLKVYVDNDNLPFGFTYKGLTAYDKDGYVVFSSYGEYPYKEVLNVSSANRLIQGRSAKIDYKLFCYPSSTGSNVDCTDFTDTSYLKIESKYYSSISTHTYAMTGENNVDNVTDADDVFAAVNSSQNGTTHSLQIDFTSDTDSSKIVNPYEYFKISVKPSFRYRFEVTGWTVYSQEGCKGDIVYASEYKDKELINIDDEIYNAKSVTIKYEVGLKSNSYTQTDPATMILEATSGKTNEGTDTKTYSCKFAIVGDQIKQDPAANLGLTMGYQEIFYADSSMFGLNEKTVTLNFTSGGDSFDVRSLKLKTKDHDYYYFIVNEVTAYDDLDGRGNVLYSYTDHYDDVTLEKVENNANAGMGKSVVLDYKLFCYPDGCGNPIDCRDFTDKAYLKVESRNDSDTSTHWYVLTGENNVDAAVKYWNQIKGGFAAIDSSHNDVQKLTINFDSDKDNGNIVNPSKLFEITASPSLHYRFELSGYSIYSGENGTGEVVFATSYGDGTFVDIVDEMYNAASIKVEYDVVVTDPDAKSQQDTAHLNIIATSGVTENGSDWDKQEHAFAIIGKDNLPLSALLQGLGVTVYEAETVGTESKELTYNFTAGSAFNARSLKITTTDTNYYRFRIKRVTAYDGKDCTGNVVYSSTNYDYKTDALASNHLYAAEGQSVTIDYKILCYPDGLNQPIDCTDKDDWAYMKVESQSGSDTSTHIYGLTGQNNVDGDPSEFVTLDDVFAAVNSTNNDTINHLTINFDSDNGTDIVNPSKLFKISTKPSFRYRIEVTGYTVYNGKDGKGDVVFASKYEPDVLYSQTFGKGKSAKVTFKVTSNYADTSWVTDIGASIMAAWDSDTDANGLTRYATGGDSATAIGSIGVNTGVVISKYVEHNSTADDSKVYSLWLDFYDSANALTGKINTPPNKSFRVIATNSKNYHFTLDDVIIYDDYGCKGDIIYQENDASDTTEYEEYEIKFPEPSSTYCTVTLPGTFDWSKATARKAGLEFTFSPAEEKNQENKRTYLAVKGIGSGYKELNHNLMSDSADYTVRVLASAIDTKWFENIKLGLYNINLKSVKVIYGKEDGNFYYCPVDEVAITAPAETEYAVGGSATLTATVGTYQTDENPVITWKSSDTSVATVDKNGKVSFVGAGTVKITAVYSGNKDGVDVVSDPVTFTAKAITIPVSSVTIDTPAKTTYEVDEVVRLTASINENATTANRAINWSSSDTSVATVDSSGKVTFLAVGTVTITAASADSPNIKASITFNCVSSDYTESEIDYTKCTTPTKIEIRQPNSDLWIMAITEEQAQSHTYVDVVITRANGTTVSRRFKIVNRGFKFISANGKKIKESGADGIYFVVARLDNVSAAGDYSVEMTLVD